MLIFREIKPNLVHASCLALGMFDGVHLGHEKVILSAVKASKEMDALSVVVTFERHPQYITSRTPTNLITTLEDRLSIFKELGVQAAIILDFNEELSRMSADEYLSKVLIGSLNAKSIAVGYDHRFGAQKKGNIEFLEENSCRYGYKLTVVPPVTIDGQIVSSSVIRKFISIGDVFDASKLLGRPFSIKGKVIMGKQRGRLLGFPTANLLVPENIISPKEGVYSGMIDVNNESYYTVVNIGKRPTFGDLEENLIEAHILDFQGDLYGKEIEISFLKRLRDEKKFNSEAELKEQIKIDCQMATVYSTSL